MLRLFCCLINKCCHIVTIFSLNVFTTLSQAANCVQSYDACVFACYIGREFKVATSRRMDSVDASRVSPRSPIGSPRSPRSPVEMSRSPVRSPVNFSRSPVDFQRSPVESPQIKHSPMEPQRMHSPLETPGSPSTHVLGSPGSRPQDRLKVKVMTHRGSVTSDSESE